MLSHLLTQLLRSFRDIFPYDPCVFTRRLVGLWASQTAHQFSRQATKVSGGGLAVQSAAAIAKADLARRLCGVSDGCSFPKVFCSRWRSA